MFQVKRRLEFHTD